jgi:hypothetical protein
MENRRQFEKEKKNKEKIKAIIVKKSVWYINVEINN